MKVNRNLLKNRNYILLIIGQFISSMGSQIQKYALALYILSITGSSTIFATVLAISIIPTIIISPIAGVLSDRCNRRKIMIILDFISFLIVLGVLIISKFVSLNIPIITIAIVSLSIIGTLYGPSVGASIPSLVSKEDLVSANSASNFIMTISGLVSPVIAGVLYAALGINFILLINCISFGISAIIEYFMQLPQEIIKTESENMFKGFISDFKEGLKYIYNIKVIFTMIMCALILNIVLEPIATIGIPYITKIILKFSDTQYGLCQGFIIGGTLVGTLLVGIVSSKIKLEKLFTLTVTIIGVLIIILGLVITPVASKILRTEIFIFIAFSFVAFCIGLILSILNIVLFSFIQKNTPNNMLGRVGATINMVTMAAIPFGQMVYGRLFDIGDSFIILTSSGMLFVIISLIIKYIFSKIGKQTDSSFEITNKILE